MRRIRVFVGICCLAWLLPASASDLTGTWVGRLACKGVDGAGTREKTSSRDRDQSREFLLPGGVSRLRMNSLVIDLPSNTAELVAEIDGTTYSGRAVLDGKKPTRKGTVVLAACANSSDATGGVQDVWRLHFSVAEAGLLGGSIRGVSLFARGAGGEIGECRGAWKMTARTASPPVAGCN